MEALAIAHARILLAVDRNPSASSAVGEAIRMAAREGAGLIVLSVVGPGDPLRSPRHLQRMDQERDRRSAELQAIVARARKAGATATYLIWEGDPAATILEAAAAEGADLIVLGSRPRTNLRRLIRGSVSGWVAHHASCEVLIVADP